MSEEEFNAADPKAVKERKRKEKREDEQAQEDLRELLRHPFGRRHLWRMLQKCHVWRSSFHPSGQQFAANEGRRSVGVELMSEIIEADPQAWIDMQQERLDEERKQSM
ncbi:MAG TPA: hypothetical protein VNI78_02225 [Vicinamibacterales bacterium]|nr:hypothetical protein [Vicinamibacterales bacterium]